MREEGTGLDGCGSGMREREGGGTVWMREGGRGRAGWMRERDKGERRGRGWIDGGVG